MQPAYEECLTIALAELTSARAKLAQEIADYPTPISGCDAQFNHLLADRSRVLAAIRALKDRPFIATPRIAEPGAAVESR